MICLDPICLQCTLKIEFLQNVLFEVQQSATVVIVTSSVVTRGNILTIGLPASLEWQIYRWCRPDKYKSQESCDQQCH
jgi:hypothetical protein